MNIPASKFNHFFSTFKLLLLCICLSGCVNHEQRDKAFKMSHDIVDHLDSDEITKLFPEQFFSRDEILRLTNDMRIRCDYQNRTGGFGNDFYERNLGAGFDKVSYIYEYFLQCDSVRIITTFQLQDEPVLIGLNIQPIEVKNIMVLKDK